MHVCFMMLKPWRCSFSLGNVGIPVNPAVNKRKVIQSVPVSKDLLYREVDMEFGGFNAAALADLLKSKDEESDSDEDQPSSAINKFNPGSIGPQKKETSKTDSAPTQAKPSKDIWEAEEVPEGSEYSDEFDPRPQPEYDLIYKQAVSSEDMFLGMSNKTPTTASCEDMVVKIQLPGAKIADVQLDVKPKFLDCRSSKYKLGLHLPHPVDSKSGKAQWDGKKEELSVTLRLIRDYDMLNF